MYSQDELLDRKQLKGNKETSIFTDTLGYAGAILTELECLVWLRSIYDVDLPTLEHTLGFRADLKGIAERIVDEHDPNYSAPFHLANCATNG